jgi:hypothetical protein
VKLSPHLAISKCSGWNTRVIGPCIARELANVVRNCPDICSISVEKIKRSTSREQHEELKNILTNKPDLKKILKGDFY